MDERARRARWQFLTAATLLVGYAGYYVCRSNLSVATPLLLQDLGGAGVDKKAIGLVASLGVLAYAVGKLVNGVIGDFLGGRRVFLLGMAFSAAATVWFGAAAGLATFIAAWMANRFVQSAGWGGLVKLAAQWFPSARYGTVMGVLSQSYLFGDAAGRLLLGGLIEGGLGWRGVFFVAAAVLLVIAGIATLLLRSGPSSVGLPEPDWSAENVYGERGGEERPQGLRDLLLPYLRRPSFWIVCFVSFGLTLVRESFNAWTPTYLVEVFGFSQAAAARASSVFPFVGGLSVLLVGFLSDGTSQAGRLGLSAPLLFVASVALVGLARVDEATGRSTGLALIGAVAFLLIGPYSLLAGAMAMDLGGKRGSATAAGLIDSAGYLGGVLSGYFVGALAQAGGWGRAFHFLAAVALVSALAASAHVWLNRRGAASAPAPHRRSMA